MRRRPRIRWVHSSSRYSRSPKSLLRFLQMIMGGADVISLTEVAEEPRAKVLSRVLGFDSLRGSGFRAADESGFLWRKGRFEVIQSWTHLLEEDTGGVRAAISCLTILFRDKLTGKTLLVSVSHLPAGIEGDLASGDLTPKVRAFLSSVDEWHRHVNELRTKFKPDGVVMAADWNLDFFREWVRVWAKKEFPNMHVNWRGNMPSQGTHGNRLIDWLVTNMKVVSAKVLSKNSSSDHRPTRTVLMYPNG